MPVSTQQYRSLRRKHKHQILLNDHEIDAFNRYCKKYKVNNKSRLIREALFTKVLQSFENDYPTLFDKDELARMERK
ncbi:MAG: hypothetical protein JEZ09_05480 [Salinivirgaceae bacterium]|nr:hypothetical protein [Salinivirgaceae bacterium]